MSEYIKMNDIKQFKSILKQGISRNTDVLLGCEFLEKLLNIINDYENTKNQLQQENKQFKDNWGKLKEWLESNWKESQDIWFVKIINKMQEIEQGSDK